MRSRMSSTDRAKQFMPFAALRGYDEAIAELNLAQEARITLGEDAAQELDAQLHRLHPGIYAAICSYNGRVYETVVGRISEIDLTNRNLTIGGTKAAFDDIIKAEEICE